MGRRLSGFLHSLFGNFNSFGGRSSAAMCLLAKCVMLSQLLLLSAEDGRALLCVPCDASGCAEPKACGGTVLGSCGCCAGCAKQRHESCGGFRGLNGTCDRGLQCVVGTSPDGGSVDVGVCEDAAWDVDLSLGSGPCRGSLVKGCDLVDRKCVCGQKWSCSSPYSFPSWDACHIALQRTEEPSDDILAPPACGALENCNLTERDCAYGFQQDLNGCRTCHCRTRKALCREMMTGCALNCPFGFQTGSQSCPVCRCRLRPRKCQPAACGKRCPHGFQKNRHGCHICRCKTCPEVTCDKGCPDGLRHDARGCPVCQCKAPASSSPVSHPGHLSPHGLRSDLGTAAPLSLAVVGLCLSKDGRRHGDGETWHDGCRDCYCHDGQEMCSLISCPPLVCLSPTLQPGHCCPFCPGGPQTEQETNRPLSRILPVCLGLDREYFAEGKTWSIDSCTQCTCLRGQVLCETKVCPPLLCQRPIRTQDSCCSQCPGDLLPAPRPSNSSCRDEVGGVYRVGESWRPDPCSSCACVDGAIKCLAESCPPVSCTDPVLHKGQCCPYCLGDVGRKAVCHYGGAAYTDEQRWHVDECTRCYCLQGQTLCSTVSCPALPCREAARASGRCCPMCSDSLSASNSRAMEVRLWDDLMKRHAPPPGGALVVPLNGGDGSQQHLESQMPGARENRHFNPAAWSALPILVVFITIAALLVINKKKRRIDILCFYRNKQVIWTDYHEGLQTDPYRPLRHADYNSRYGGAREVPEQNNLQDDGFYQTV
nr:cysteine-rich motor neuron 1 protein-like isoform X1 [Paramormyrops kingsleyae]